MTRPPDTQDRHGILIRQLQGAMSTAVQVGDAAGGALAGTYPNPTLAAGAAKANLRIAWGVATATFASAASGGSSAIPHGMGVTPTIVVATARPTGDGREDYVVTSAGRDATNIVFAMRAAAGEHYTAAGVTVTFDWIAIA